MVNIFNRIQIILLILLLPFLGLHFYAKSQDVSIRELFAIKTPIAIVGEIPMTVEIVSTPEARVAGLSGRQNIGNYDGMLFVFDKDDTYAFWMKDMKFSIDIIWLAVNGTVVDLAENVSPSTYPQSFRPKVPARFVLEVPAGFAREYMVRVGDVAKLP